MKKHHVLSVIVVAVALALALVAMPSSASAAVVIGNLSGSYTPGIGLDLNWKYAAGVTVPGGMDYTLNSFQAAISNTVAGPNGAVAELWSDNGLQTAPGAFITALGPAVSIPGSAPTTVYTFTPFAPYTLTQGTTYWFVVRGTIVSQNIRWDASSASPAGTFSFNTYAFYDPGAGWGGGAVVAAFAIDATAVGGGGGSTPSAPADVPPDDRINWRHGDGYAIFYSRLDEHAEPVLHTYCISAEGTGTLELIVTQDMLDKYPEFPDKPAQNRELFQSSVCRTPFFFYILTTGEYQINVGPDWEGKVDVIIFTGMPPGNVYFYSYDVFHPIQWQ